MNQPMVIFLILLLGYFIGNIKFFGLKMGSSAVLIVSLVFGHFGFEISSIIKDIGLILFVTAVGFIAGPTFFRNFKNKVMSYITLGIIVVVSGAISCIAIIKLSGIPTPLAVGMLSGALTSTPGLAAAIEATGDSMASIGYGIAYPFGVLGVVLFIQLVPKLLKIDLSQEAAKLEENFEGRSKEIKNNVYINIDSFGLFSFSLAVVLGIIVAGIKIPLPGGINFSLGNSGGPLLLGLAMGHFNHIKNYSITVPKTTLEVMREFGLVLFLLGAGTDAGKGFISILQQYGVSLFFIGVIMTLLPMIISYFFARKVLRLDLLNTLGSICGGMTSTPALGTLISVAQSDVVTTAYAATYPVALILVVLASQLIGLFF